MEEIKWISGRKAGEDANVRRKRTEYKRARSTLARPLHFTNMSSIPTQHKAAAFPNKGELAQVVDRPTPKVRQSLSAGSPLV